MPRLFLLLRHSKNKSPLFIRISYGGMFPAYNSLISEFTHSRNHQIDSLNLLICPLQLVTTQVYFRFTRQTDLQLSNNQPNNLAPSIRLAPNLRKSYKMFFQNVTRSIAFCFTIINRPDCSDAWLCALSLAQLSITNRCKCYERCLFTTAIFLTFATF